MTIVLCSKGYPGQYKKDVKIKHLNKVRLAKNDNIYHAGTRFKKKQLVSCGGRVLNITSNGKKLSVLRKRIITIIKKINWKKGFFRKDIGWKAIKYENY